MIWLMQAAMAADLSAAVGLEAAVNDPFLVQAGLRASGEAALRPWLSVGLSGGLYPYLGEQSHRRLTTELLEEYAIFPDLSPMRWRGMAEARIVPLTVVHKQQTRRLSLHAGLGMVQTEDIHDDLWALEEFQSTAIQVHPMTSVGMSAEVHGETLGIRVRMERTAYVEDVMVDIEHDRKNGWVGVELTIRQP